MNEKLSLEDLKDCPKIISGFGESISFENGDKLYNVLLENASDKVENSEDQRLLESEVWQYAKALLKGLHYIHKFGYVHCDIKLQNILLGPNGGINIADFRLTKRVRGKRGSFLGCELRRMPLYMSLEPVTSCEQGSPSDIWALGVRCSGDGDMAALLMRIGVGEEFLFQSWR